MIAAVRCAISAAELRTRYGVIRRMRVVAAAALLAVPLAACGTPPEVTASVAGRPAPTVLLTSSKQTAWGQGEVGDAFPQEEPLTTVRSATPVTLRIEASPDATEIRGWLYDVDRPTASGGPLEEFRLPGRSVAYVAKAIVAGRTYEVVVNARWGGLLVRGEVTRAFRLRVEPP